MSPTDGLESQVASESRGAPDAQRRPKANPQNVQLKSDLRGMTFEEGEQRLAPPGPPPDPAPVQRQAHSGAPTGGTGAVVQREGVDDIEHLDSLRSGDTAMETSNDAKGLVDPKKKLPFDAEGDWDGLAILKQWGQYDPIKKTDSDGARCVQAVALASHIVHGPDAVTSYLGTMVSARLAQVDPGSESKADAGASRAKLTKREDTAVEVLMTVYGRIESTTATYGDLWWAAEALHDLFTTDDNAGTQTEEVMDTVVPRGLAVLADSYLTDAAVGRPFDTLAGLAGEIDGLTDGQQLILFTYTSFVNGGEDSSGWGHQCLVIKSGGKLTFYDPAQEKPAVAITKPYRALSDKFGVYGAGQNQTKRMMFVQGKIKGLA